MRFFLAGFPSTRESKRLREVSLREGGRVAGPGRSFIPPAEGKPDPNRFYFFPFCVLLWLHLGAYKSS